MPPTYPAFSEFLPEDASLTSGHYLASFASNRDELEEVQRLRFGVFNLEMGEGLDESFKTRMDIDPFDDQCHHLIVRDVKTGELVGTYRMQNLKMATAGLGFYSATEYVFDAFSEEFLSQSLELGRACIAGKHRNGRVLFLLWRGLLYYLRSNKLRYMFGCCSLTSQDEAEGWSLYKRLKRTDSLHTVYCLPARPDYMCPHLEPKEEEVADAVTPRLMQLYLDYGAKICSEPALDREFKTIDYLALFDLWDIPPKLMKVFKKDLA
ncbi:GNAT family N-acetyltransferase [Kiritimatiellaeota bacterium B1221]|nr:GNAT family N-acetyltransferase [Kiritimatiellaeota bacterium B1221]